MKLRFEILRQAPGAKESHIQTIDFETANDNATVATALGDMNRDPGLKDVSGAPVGRIAWECSCLQKKCGACAMRINGRPRLACDARLSELGAVVRLEPLRKFPVIEDLLVDRSVMMQNLRRLSVWLEEEARTGSEGMAFEAARCLQCGLCLEVCPNFAAGGAFAGMAAMAPMSRLIARLSEGERKRIARAYQKGVYSGCGKSLACRDICPAQLRIEDLLVRSSAAAVWKRWRPADM